MPAQADFRAPAVLPADLKKIPNWLCWRLTQIPGERKPRKVPFYTTGEKRTGTQGSDADRAKFVSYDRAVAAVVKGNYSGIGFAVLPDCGVFALDFDDVVVDGVVDPRVMRVVAGSYAEYSPSGKGVRAFFKGSKASRKDLDNDPKIELFGSNGFVTVTGHCLPEHTMIGWDEVLADETPACAEFLADRFGDTSSSTSRSVDLFETLSPKLDLSPERVSEILHKLRTDLPYDEWIKAGVATHHELGDAGWPVWLAWSKTSPKFTTDAYAHARWRSFGRYTGGQVLTFAWVLKQAGEAAHLPSAEGFEVMPAEVDEVTRLRGVIADAVDEADLRTRVCGMISRARLQDTDRAVLAPAVQDRLAALGVKLPIGDVRKMLAPVKRAPARGLPNWAQGWCYVEAEDRFLCVADGDTLSKQAFDARHNRDMPRDQHGVVMRAASVVCLEDWKMRTVRRVMYQPQAGQFFEHEGNDYFNSYRADSVPVAAASSGGTEALIVAHIDRLCGGRPEVARSLIQWMAHNVQHPGVKVHWAPIIVGAPGVGKSLLGGLLRSTMGVRNVVGVSPKVIGTDFTGWAEGACVRVLEELRIHGHNRYDVLNALKPYITDGEIEVHRKGRDAYDAPNTQNYIAFTNHSDALPIDNTDRRWFVIISPWTTRAEMGVPDDYFKGLFDLIHGRGPELRRWLMDVDLTGFEAKGTAPDTDDKAEMIALSVSDEEETLRDVIEAGGFGVGHEVLSASHLSSLLRIAGFDPDRILRGRALSRLGWRKAVPRPRWRGQQVRVWFKGRPTFDPTWALQGLDKTDGSDLF